ncbi:hypothetical protein D9M70_474070 [compost metagenome]
MRQCRQRRSAQVFGTGSTGTIVVEYLVVGLQLQAPHSGTQLWSKVLKPSIHLLHTTADGLARQTLKLIFFHAAQHESTHRLAELLAQARTNLIALMLLSRKNGLDPGIPIRLPTAQQTRLSSIHQAPEVTQTVFHRRTRGQQFEVSLNAFGCARLERVGVLDVLCFIKDHHPPVDSAQRKLVVAQGLVSGQNQTSIHIETMDTRFRPDSQCIADALLIHHAVFIGKRSQLYRFTLSALNPKAA